MLSVLAVVMDGSLRLFHPLMPFITEELYQRLASTGLEVGLYGVVAACGEVAATHATATVVSTQGTHGTGAVSSIVEQPFPSPTSVSMFLDPKAEADMAVLLGAVKAGRSLRKTATDILGKARKDVLYVEASDDVSSLIEAHQSVGVATHTLLLRLLRCLWSVSRIFNARRACSHLLWWMKPCLAVSRCKQLPE